MNTDDTKAIQTITPTRQEVVPLFDHFIVAVSLPDGRIAATLASLCDALGLTQSARHDASVWMMCWPMNWSLWPLKRAAGLK